MPQSQQSNKVALELLKLNVSKMNKFYTSVVNPATLAKLIIELNAVKIKDVEIQRGEPVDDPVETEDNKMFTFKNSKRSNASAGDILNLQSFKQSTNLNETLDQFKQLNQKNKMGRKNSGGRRLKVDRMSIRSLSSRGPALGANRGSVASNASMVTRKIIKPLVPNNFV